MKKLSILLYVSLLFSGEIEDEIEKLNSNLPQKIDSFTIFEKAIYHDNKIDFIKTLDNSNIKVRSIIESSKWNMVKMNIIFNEKFQNCKNIYMKNFLKNGGKLYVKYYGKDKSRLIFIPITYRDCNSFKYFDMD